MADGTRISFVVDCSDLVKNIDQAAAKIETFQSRASGAFNTVDAVVDKMGKNQKRTFKNLKKTYDQHLSAIASMVHRYEELRAKSVSGQKMTQAEYNELKSLSEQYKRHAGAIATVTKQMESMVKYARIANFTVKNGGRYVDAMSSAIGGTMAIAFSKVCGLTSEFAKDIVKVGLETQQTVSQFEAMKNSLTKGAEAYQTFNDVGRNTNYDMQAVNEMGKQLLNLGYNANEASELIQLCADTAAGLGKGQAGAQQLVEAMSRIQAAGSLSSKQIVSLQMAGLDMDKVFEGLGHNAESAMEALKDGTLDGEAALKALTNYMHSFDGKMAESKDNIIDMWGDVTGNVSTACGEIGASIADAFKNTGIVQDLIDITQEFIDLVRSDCEGAFHDLKAVAEWAFGVIGDCIHIVWVVLKAGIVVMNGVYQGFKEMGTRIVEALEPILTPLKNIWNVIANIMHALGKGVEGVVNIAWNESFSSNSPVDPTDMNDFMDNRNNKRFKTGGGKTTEKTASGKGAAEDKEAKRLAQEEEKKYQDILKNTIKLTEEFTKVKTKTLDITRKISMIGASRAEQLKAEIKWAEEDYETQKKAEDELHKSTMDKLNEQIEFYKANPGLPGSEKTIEALGKQKDKENELHEARMEAITAEKDLKIASNKEVLDALGINENPGSDLSGDSFNGLGQGLDKFMQAKEYLQTLGIEMTKLETLAMNTFGKSFATAFQSIVDGSKSAKEAFTDMAKQLLVQCLNLLAQWTAIFALVSMFGDPKDAAKAANKMVLGLATGGYVSGPGTSTSDSIPAMLSDGEYVLNAAAVRAVGVGNLNALNYGRSIQYAEGGSVGNSVPSGPARNLTVNVSALDPSSFSDFLGRGGLNSIKQALFEDDRQFGSAVGVW